MALHGMLHIQAHALSSSHQSQEGGPLRAACLRSRMLGTTVLPGPARRRHASCIAVLVAALVMLLGSRGASAFTASVVRRLSTAGACRATSVAAVRTWARPAVAASSPATARLAAFARPTSVRLMAAAAGSGSAPDPRVKVRAAHILVKTEAQADEILKRLDGGEDFGEIAMVESECPSKQQGGDLGWFGTGQMVPEFEQACFGNEPGARVKVQTQFGYHVIQVVSKARAPGDMHPTQLGDLLGNPSEKAEYQLIDVREPDELQRADINGAGFLNLPLSQFPQWGPKIMSGELLDKGKKTVVLCHHGGRSMQVASFLASQAGFTDVFNLSGGIHMYSSMVDSSIPQY